MRILFAVFCATLILSGCDAPDKFEAREDRIKAALKNNDDTLGSKAVWLVKRSSPVPDNRTAVFFGYGDNRLACDEFAAAYNQAYPEVEYVCDALD